MTKHARHIDASLKAVAEPLLREDRILVPHKAPAHSLPHALHERRILDPTPR